MQVVKKGLGERLNYFSISSRLGHKPNYPLRLVGVTFFKLAQALRDVWTANQGLQKDYPKTTQGQV